MLNQPSSENRPDKMVQGTIRSSEFYILQEQFNEKLSEKEKEKTNHIIDNFKWCCGIVATVFTLLLLASFINFNSEKRELETFKKELKNELLGDSQQEADIIFLGHDKKILKNQTLTIRSITRETKSRNNVYYKYPLYAFKYSVILKNQGKGLAEKPFLKFYFTEEMAGDFLNSNYSSDEPNYDYEDVYNLDSTPLSRIPFNVTMTYTVIISTFKEIKPGTYPVKIKIYYGKNSKVSESEFKIRIPSDTKITDFYN